MFNVDQIYLTFYYKNVKFNQREIYEMLISANERVKKCFDQNR